MPPVLRRMIGVQGFVLESGSMMKIWQYGIAIIECVAKTTHSLYRINTPSPVSFLRQL